MAKAYSPLPHASELWELFDYKPLTGELVWKRPTSNRVKKGDVAGAKGREGGRDLRLHGRLYRLHRLIWCWVTAQDPGTSEVDHRDRNRGNNRFWNLRLGTRAQNMWNTPARGYRQMPNGRYFSTIRVGGDSPIYLGSFDTAEEAGAAYAKAAAELHGEFACAE